MIECDVCGATVREYVRVRTEEFRLTPYEGALEDNVTVKRSEDIEEFCIECYPTVKVGMGRT